MKHNNASLSYFYSQTTLTAAKNNSHIPKQHNHNLTKTIPAYHNAVVSPTHHAQHLPLSNSGTFIACLGSVSTSVGILIFSFLFRMTAQNLSKHTVIKDTKTNDQGQHGKSHHIHLPRHIKTKQNASAHQPHNATKYYSCTIHVLAILQSTNYDSHNL